MSMMCICDHVDLCVSFCLYDHALVSNILTLYATVRSVARLAMSKCAEALDDAKEALMLAPQYVEVKAGFPL